MRSTYRGRRLLAFIALAMCGSVASGADFVVTNTSDSGIGSLREAIAAANALPDPDIISFDIPGNGVRKISLETSLPPLTNPVTIDGYTQPGAKPNTRAAGSDAVLLIQIESQNNYREAFVVSGGNSVIRGVSLTGLLGRFGPGATPSGAIVLSDKGGNVITGNFLGLAPDGTRPPGEPQAGVQVKSTGNVIGGTRPADRNVIAGNTLGVELLDTANGCTVAGNYIGTNPAGAEALPNRTGVRTLGILSNTVVGGTAPGAGNIISGNIGVGMYLSGGVRVVGNVIGTAADRSSPLGNASSGIYIDGPANTIGGPEGQGVGNVIANNGASGVSVRGIHANFPAVRNAILSNAIYSNAGLGIDLIERHPNSIGSGPTSNDLGDNDSGPNNLQNFPIITSAGTVGGGPISEPNSSIRGRLNSAPNAEFTIQYFRYSPAPKLLGSRPVQTDAAGNADITFFFYLTPAEQAQGGSYYTATATDAEGNTSEFMPQNGPVQLANISTRASVLGGEFLVIGGFIIRSENPKKVGMRALGPSLSVANRLADPYLELYDSSGTLLAKNDDWRAGQQQDIIASGLAPASDVEPALITTLAPGSYTAQVRGVNGGTGTGLVEVYDLDPFTATSGRLANISTRGFVDNGGTDVMIGGVIVRGDAPQRVIVRAIGLDGKVDAPLRDPTLELRDSNGDLLAANDNWREGQQAEVAATGLAPTDDRDSAIVTRLAPGAYTAILRGKTTSGGIALVEFYDLTN